MRTGYKRECAVLCSAVQCCAVLYCAVLCCAVLYCTTLYTVPYASFIDYFITTY